MTTLPKLMNTRIALRCLDFGRRSLIWTLSRPSNARLQSTDASQQPTTSSFPMPPTTARYNPTPLEAIEMPGPPTPLSFRQKYGQPIASFFLWTSLVFVTLEFAYAAMETDEVRERTEMEIEGLQRQLEEAKERAAAKANSDSGDLDLAPTRGVTAASARTRTWWEFFFGSAKS